MKGSLSHELDMELAAGEVWDFFGSLRLVPLIPILLPGQVAKIDVEEGDGGVGTILCVNLAPG